MCTLQDSFHLSRNLCPSHLPPPPKESSQGQGTFQPNAVCPAGLGDNKKQFIMSLHCEVIRNQWRFPSSLGFPLSDNSMGGFALGPCLPYLLSDFPSLSVSFPPRASEALATKCQRARQARGLLVFGPSCLQTICPDGWSREGLLSMPLNHSRDSGPGRALVCLSFPPPTLTSPPHPLRNPNQPK